jgi:hypothetical protein
MRNGFEPVIVFNAAATNRPHRTSTTTLERF